MLIPHMKNQKSRTWTDKWGRRAETDIGQNKRKRPLKKLLQKICPQREKVRWEDVWSDFVSPLFGIIMSEISAFSGKVEYDLCIR